MCARVLTVHGTFTFCYIFLNKKVDLTLKESEVSCKRSREEVKERGGDGLATSEAELDV